MFKGKYQFSGVLVFGRVGILPIFIGFTHKMTFCTYLTHEFTYQFHPFYPICIEDVSPTFQSPVSRDCEALAYPYEANDCREAEKFPANLNGRIYSWGVGDLYMWMFPKIVDFPPKSSILIGISIIFTIHFGVPLFLETPMYIL